MTTYRKLYLQLIWQNEQKLDQFLYQKKKQVVEKACFLVLKLREMCYRTDVTTITLIVLSIQALFIEGIILFLIQLLSVRERSYKLCLLHRFNLIGHECYNRQLYKKQMKRRKKIALLCNKTWARDWFNKIKFTTLQKNTIYLGK